MEFRARWVEDPKAFFDRMSGDIQGGFQRGILRATLAGEAAVVEEAPVVEGNLRDAITSYLQGSGTGSIGYVVPTAPYSEFVHGGTGIYGPNKTPIVARVKKALAFVYGGQKLVRKSVKGQRPNPFIKRAKKTLERDGTLGREFWEGFNAGGAR